MRKKMYAIDLFIQCRPGFEPATYVIRDIGRGLADALHVEL